MERGTHAVKANAVIRVLEALSTAGVRFIVAGGLAVNVHGVIRLTHDIDLVVQLKRENIEKAFASLQGAGYRPSVPVVWESFADPDTRQRWIDEKAMKVLNFWSDTNWDTPVDVFVIEPFDFENEYEAAVKRSFAGMESIRFVSLPTLLEMKKAAGRAKDLSDIAELRLIADE